MKRFILSNDSLSMVSIDSGNHSGKILSSHGKYIHPQAFSMELNKRKGSDKRMIEHYLQEGQAPSDILYFIKRSDNEDLTSSDGLLIGHSALFYSDYTKDDITFSERYSPEVYFFSTRYLQEMLGYIALGLWNFDKKCYDKQDQDLILNLGLPASMAEDKELVKNFKAQFEGKTFTLETVIGAEENEKNTFDGLCKTIQFTIKKVYVYSQSLGSIASLAFNDKGEINPEYASLLEEDTLCLDGGYVTWDIYRLLASRIQTQDIDSFKEFGMQAIHQELSEIWSEYNDLFKDVHEVRKLDDSGAIDFPLKNGKLEGKNKKYSDVRKDIEDETTRKIRKFKEIVIRKYDNFTNVGHVLFAGGTGSIFYNKLKPEFKNSIALAKSPYIEDDVLGAIFANVEGYNNLTISKMLMTNTITSDQLVEVEVSPVIEKSIEKSS